MHDSIRRERQPPAQHGLVQEQQRRHRLILRRCTYPNPLGEMLEKRPHLGLAQLVGMPAAVKHDEPLDPPDIRLFGARAVMPRPHRRPQPAEQGPRRYLRATTVGRHPVTLPATRAYTRAKYCVHMDRAHHEPPYGNRRRSVLLTNASRRLSGDQAGTWIVPCPPDTYATTRALLPPS